MARTRALPSLPEPRPVDEVVAPRVAASPPPCMPAQKPIRGSKQVSNLTSRSLRGHCRFSNTDVFVRPSIIEEIPLFQAHHTLDKDDIGNLSDLFPFAFRAKDRLIRARHHFCRIVAIKDSHGGSID